MDSDLKFHNQFFVVPGVTSEEAQFKRAYQLFKDGWSVCVHRHPPGLTCVPMTETNGSNGCVRLVDGGTDSTGVPVGATLVDIATTD